MDMTRAVYVVLRRGAVGVNVQWRQILICICTYPLRMGPLHQRNENRKEIKHDPFPPHLKLHLVIS